jgi:hypothetical protein
MVRDAFAGLLDQRTPFGRLALVHVVLTAGDTLVTVSLAGSLFFSISPKAAEGKVFLYLLLTMAPFAVVAPLLGPVIDRSRGARRATVAMSSGCRAVVCLVMAGGLHSLLLFPEAFTMLVLSKVYLVTKGSLVPLLASTGDAARADGSPPPVPSSEAAAPGVASRAAVGGEGLDAQGAAVDPNRLATANAQLGLLASLAGFAAAVPAVVVLKLLGGAWVLRLDMVVFVAGTVVALRLPIRDAQRTTHRHRVTAPPPTGATSRPWQATGPLAALGPGVTTHPEVTLALSAMSVLKAIVGFLTFLLAFDLRRAHAALFWYGLALGASTAGAVAGVLIVPRARRLFSEQQVLTLAVWLVAMGATMAAAVGGIVIQAALAFLIGVAGAAGKPSFDALVQRYVPVSAQGRAFARFETKLQLVWVLGALIPVVAAIPLVAGDIVIAAVAAVAALSYLTGRRAVRYLESRSG